jgi:prevent-host-death family protein
MKIVTIPEAKAQLYKLIEEAVNGESFLISVAGEPLVKVTALDACAGRLACRIGFMEGQISVPEDFDQMGKRGD